MHQKERTIVVVEDDASLREALERLLSVAGFKTRSFADAEQLLEASAARSAACLVLDVDLPLLSGFDLHQQLLKSGIRPPTVFISAHDEPEARLQATAAGAAYLPKPFAAQRLVEAVNHAISA